MVETRMMDLNKIVVSQIEKKEFVVKDTGELVEQYIKNKVNLLLLKEIAFKVGMNEDHFKDYDIKINQSLELLKSAKKV